MPPLTTTLGLNITPYISAMNTVRDVSSKAGTVTQASLRGAAREIEAAMVMAQGAGERTTFYAASLKAVNEQLAILSVNEAKATAASEALALSQAKVAAGFGAQRDVTAVNAAVVASNIARLKGPVSAKEGGELKKLFDVAAAGGVGASLGTGIGFGHGGGPGGGISGILRETLVIMREIMRHNFSRVPGSIALLAQYLGLLGIVVKSSAKDSLVAAAAEDKLAAAMSRTALVAKAKAAASAEAIVAEGADAEATLDVALADEASYLAAKKQAMGQIEKATASRAAAEIQLAGARTSIAAGGYIAAGLIAVGVAAFFIYRHFHNLAMETKNLLELMNPFKKSYQDEADALKEQNKVRQEFQDWLKKELDTRLKLTDVIDHQLKLIKDEADAQRRLAELRGATAMQLEQMDENNLRRQLQILQAGLAVAKQQRDAAMAAAASASQGFDANPTNDEGVTLKGAQHVAENAAKVADAVLAASEPENIIAQLQEQNLLHPETFDTHFKTGEGNNDIAGGTKDILSKLDLTDISVKTQGALIEAIMRDNEGRMPGGVSLGEILGAAKNLSRNEPVTGVKVGSQAIPDMTVQQATDAADKANAMASALEQTVQQEKDLIESTKGTATERQQAFLKLQEQVDVLSGELGIKTKYGPQEAAMGKGGGDIGKVTERERVGIGTPQVALLSVAQKTLAAIQTGNAIQATLLNKLTNRSKSVNKGDVFDPFHSGHGGVSFGGFE